MADRTPRTGDRVVLYGERMTILRVVTVEGQPTHSYVMTKDDAGFVIQRRIDALWFDPDADAWREVGYTDKWPEGDVVVPLDLTELVP